MTETHTDTHSDALLFSNMEIYRDYYAAVSAGSTVGLGVNE